MFKVSTLCPNFRKFESFVRLPEEDDDKMVNPKQFITNCIQTVKGWENFHFPHEQGYFIVTGENFCKKLDSAEMSFGELKCILSGGDKLVTAIKGVLG